MPEINRKKPYHVKYGKKQRLDEFIFYPTEEEPHLKYSVGKTSISFIRNVLNQMQIYKPNDIIVTINNIDISLLMLKTLNPFISLEEEDYLISVNENFRKGHLCDPVIDAYFFLLTNKFKKCKAVRAKQSVELFNQQIIPSFSWFSEIRNLDLFIIPVIFNCHWTLIIFNIRLKSLEYFDPLGNEPNKEALTLINQWCNILNTWLNSGSCWKIDNPPHVKQTDNYNCGVFICFFVYQKLNKCSLTENFDTNEFRARILKKLLKFQAFYYEN